MWRHEAAPLQLQNSTRGAGQLLDTVTSLVSARVVRHGTLDTRHVHNEHERTRDNNWEYSQVYLHLVSDVEAQSTAATLENSTRGAGKLKREGDYGFPGRVDVGELQC